MPGRLERLCLGALLGAFAVAGCSDGATRGSEGKQGGGGTAGVRLSPSPAYAASRIAVVFDDPWLDATKCRFVWKRDGVVIPGAEGSSLDPSQFYKGQRISVEVSVQDSTAGGRPPLTAEVDVVNTPPKVTGATLLLSAGSGPAEIRANVQATDTDGDGVTYEYRWFKNGAALEAESGTSLVADKLARGDRVEVEVVASDGRTSSTPFRSDPLTIQNRAPQFTSQPRGPRAGDTEFRYQVVAEDRDGDPLRYELVGAPEGMTLDPSGTIIWPLPAPDQRQGDHPVSVKATDAKGGEAVQQFSIRLDPPAKNP